MKNLYSYLIKQRKEVDLGNTIINPFALDLILEGGDAWREEINEVFY